MHTINKMRFVLVFVAVLGATNADSWEGLQWFLGCCTKAITDGIPSFPIPKHDPLIMRNITYNHTSLLFDADIEITNGILYNLLNFTWPVLNITDLSNPTRNYINYDIYWPLLNATGDFYINYKVPLLPAVKYSGTYNVLLHHIDWWGIFDFVQPGQEGVRTEVDQFTLNSKIKDVDVELTGFIGKEIVEAAVEDVIKFLFNHFPSAAADFLRVGRFNGFWIDHPENIKAVFDFCSEN